MKTGRDDVEKKDRGRRLCKRREKLKKSGGREEEKMRKRIDIKKEERRVNGNEKYMSGRNKTWKVREGT